MDFILVVLVVLSKKFVNNAFLKKILRDDALRTARQDEA